MPLPGARLDWTRASLKIGPEAPSNVSFAGADLRNARISKTSFHGADMRGVDLAGAFLRKVDLRGCDLSSSSLTGTTMRRIRTDSSTRLPEADPVLAAKALWVVALREQLFRTEVQDFWERGLQIKAADQVNLENLALDAPQSRDCETYTAELGPALAAIAGREAEDSDVRRCQRLFMKFHDLSAAYRVALLIQHGDEKAAAKVFAQAAGVAQVRSFVPGVIALSCERLAEAISHFERAASTAGSEEDLHRATMRLAMALVASGQAAPARQRLESLLSSGDPDVVVRAKLLLADNLTSVGPVDYSRAGVLLHDVIMSDNPLLAALAREMKRSLNSALQSLLGLSTRFPRSPQARRGRWAS